MEKTDATNGSFNKKSRLIEADTTSVSMHSLFLTNHTLDAAKLPERNDEADQRNHCFPTHFAEAGGPRVEAQMEPSVLTGDCTPTCGPNYLIEVQNPTWEVALYMSFVSAMEALSSETLEDTFILSALSSGFTATISSTRNDYDLLPSNLPCESDPFLAASELMNCGKIVEAIPLLEDSIAFRPKSSEVWTLLALANYLCQNDIKAIFSCKECLRTDVNQEESSHNLVLLLLGTCLSNEGDVAAAQAVIFEWMVRYLGLTDNTTRNILKFLPPSSRDLDEKTFVPVLVNICNMYTEKSDSDGTLQWALAILHFGVGNYAVAGRHFERVLARNPFSPSVLNQVGACLHNLHMYGEALSLQNRALQICPGFPRAYYNKALTLCAMNDFDEALLQIQQSVEHQQQCGAEISDQFWYLAAKVSARLNSKDPETHCRRGKILAAILSRDVATYKAALLKDNPV